MRYHTDPPTGRGRRASVRAPLRLAPLALALLAASASAETVTPYIPGGAPCNGACTQPWAEALAGAPGGDARAMMIPAGTLIHGMSYGRVDADGVRRPHWTERPMRLSTDQTGRGYAFEATDGRLLHMVRLDECENWTLVEMPAPDIAAPGGSPASGGGVPSVISAAPAIPLGIGAAAALASLGGRDGRDGVDAAPRPGGPGVQPPPIIIVKPPQPVNPGVTPPGGTNPPPIDPPTSVPLPGALWMLLAGVGLLWWKA